MKLLLFAAYIFSILYCYLEINGAIDRCVDVFKERHPTIPIKGSPFNKGLRLGVEILAISAVPVANVFLGYFISTMDENVISEVIKSVELNHWKEIRDTEEISGKFEDLDKYF